MPMSPKSTSRKIAHKKSELFLKSNNTALRCSWWFLFPGSLTDLPLIGSDLAISDHIFTLDSDTVKGSNQNGFPRITSLPGLSKHAASCVAYLTRFVATLRASCHIN
ncbi:hypothetical protein ABKN59_001384 [Abortiporus biennis]